MIQKGHGIECGIYRDYFFILLQVCPNIPPVSVLPTPNLGRAGARGKGLETADFELICV